MLHHAGNPPGHGEGGSLGYGAQCDHAAVRKRLEWREEQQGFERMVLEASEMRQLGDRDKATYTV